MPILENWSVQGRTDPYEAPELQRKCLVGNVYGHPDYPRIMSGEFVTTSYIERVDGDCVITHSGTRYELGKVDAEYEKRCPNAKERLFGALAKAA